MCGRRRTSACVGTGRKIFRARGSDGESDTTGNWKIELEAPTLPPLAPASICHAEEKTPVVRHSLFLLLVLFSTPRAPGDEDLALLLLLLSHLLCAPRPVRGSFSFSDTALSYEKLGESRRPTLSYSAGWSGNKVFEPWRARELIFFLLLCPEGWKWL